MCFLFKSPIESIGESGKLRPLFGLEWKHLAFQMSQVGTLLQEKGIWANLRYYPRRFKLKICYVFFFLVVLPVTSTISLFFLNHFLLNNKLLKQIIYCKVVVLMHVVVSYLMLICPEQSQFISNWCQTKGRWEAPVWCILSCKTLQKPSEVAHKHITQQPWRWRENV